MYTNLGRSSSSTILCSYELKIHSEVITRPKIDPKCTTLWQAVQRLIHLINPDVGVTMPTDREQRHQSLYYAKLGFPLALLTGS